MKGNLTRAYRFFKEFVMVVCGVLAVVIVAAILVAGIYQICEWCNLIRKSRNANTAVAIDLPAEGVGRAVAVQRYAGPEAEGTARSLWVVCEDDPVLPDWWDPDGAVLVYSDAPKKDAECPDWNADSTVYGWDGHMAKAWELDLMARVFYLEFWGTSLPCSEAGCDAILNLWDTGNYGRTLFEALSYYDPDYGYTYRVYPRVWQTDYDANGLAWCKEFCMDRFLDGPEWSAVYFQLGGYHDTDWVPPLYEIDGVYFSGEGQ